MEQLDNFVEDWYRYWFEYFEDDDEVHWNTKPNDEIMDAYLRDKFFEDVLEWWDGRFFSYPHPLHHLHHNHEDEYINDIMDFKTCCNVMNIINLYLKDCDDLKLIDGLQWTPTLIVRVYAHVYMKNKSLEQLKDILGIEEQSYVLK